MQKNVASQVVSLTVIDVTTGLGKTGDASNQVWYIQKDGGTITAISSNSGVPTEVDSTNAKGEYKITLSQAETNANILRITGKSSTSNIFIISVTIPTFPANFSTQSIDTSGAVLLQPTQTGVTIPTVTAVGTTANLTNAPTAGDLTATMKASVTTAATAATPTAAAVTAGVTLASSQHVIVDSGTVTTVTNQLTAAAIATGVWQDTTAGDFTTASSIGKSLYNAFTAGTSVFTTASLVNAPTGGSAPTAAAIATAVWQDTTTGDFTVSASIGKSIMNGVALGTGLTVNTLTNAPSDSSGVTTLLSRIGGSITISGGKVAATMGNTDYTGNTVQTGDSYVRIGLAGVGLSNLGDSRIAHLDADISSRMSSYNQPTGFLTATFPNGTISNTTNITAGTITTVTTTTNLTNAPTVGDFTSTMKTSLNAATPASIQNVHSQSGDAYSHLDDLIPNRILMTSGKIWALNDQGNPIANEIDLQSLITTLGTPSTSSLSGDIAALPTATVIADTTLRRHMSNVESSASGDTLSISSIYGMVQMTQQAGPVSGTSLPIYETNRTTVLHTMTLTAFAGADPITGVSI